MTLAERLRSLIHTVLDSYSGAWLAWCDPHGHWGPLLERVATLAPGFALVSVTERTAGELGGPRARWEVQAHLDRGEPSVLHLAAGPDDLGWLWAQCLLAERRYERSLRDQLREWGWRPPSLTFSDAELAELARRLIDLVKVELDQSLESGVYWATLMTANILNVNISAALLQKYERLLLAGVGSNVLVGYDDTIRYRGKTFPFVIQRLEPVQVGSVDLAEYRAGRATVTRDQWIDALVRTMGYEPTGQQMTERVKLLYLVRLVPLVEQNYRLIELGPRQTGKSFCFMEFSPYGTLLAGGAVTVPKLFVSNTALPRPGLINQRDVVGFDEIAGSAFNADDDKNLYKNYMESGQINRGTITVKGDAGFVFNGNINFAPREGLLAEHLFKPLPATVADDTAFHDRWAAFLPGWELPKLTPELFTPHVGFILDYVSEIFHRELRPISTYGTLWQRWFEATPHAWTARDMRSVCRTFSGLAKLIFPGGELTKDDARLLLRLALELHRMSPREFPLTEFTYHDLETGAVEQLRLSEG